MPGQGESLSRFFNMPVDTLEIYNMALLKLGARPLTSLSDDSTEGRLVKALYQTSFKYVLSAYPFTRARTRAKLLPDGDGDPVFGWLYQYNLPNKLLYLLEVYDKNDYRVYDFQIEGSKILTDYETEIRIVYIQDISTDNKTNPQLAEAIACWLAYQASMRLRDDRDPNVKAQLLNEYQRALSAAKASDSKENAPLFYGNNAPEDSLYMEDQPTTWIDERL